MEKLLAILFSLALGLALAGCNGGEERTGKAESSVLLTAVESTVPKADKEKDGCPTWPSDMWFKCEQIKNMREQNRLLAELIKTLQSRP